MDVKIPEFFDFVTETFKYYKDYMTKESFINMFGWIVNRILKEVEKNIKSSGSADKENDSQTTAVKTTMSAQKW